MSQNVENMIDVTSLFYPEGLFPDSTGDSPLNIREIRKEFENYVKDNPDFNDKEYCFVELITDYDDTRVYLTTSKPAEMFFKPLVETAGSFYSSYKEDSTVFDFNESDLRITLFSIAPKEGNGISFTATRCNHES